MTVESKLIAKIETVGAEKATDSLRKLTKQAEATERASKAMGKALAGTFTVAAISKTISGMVDVAHRYDDIADAAERIGVSVKEFRALQYAGNDVGMSAEQMSKAFLNTEKAMLKLQTTGKGGLANALKALGDQTKLTTADFANLSGEEGAQKLVSEMERLGVSHRDQIVLLDGVSKGLSKMLPLLQDNGSAMKQLKNASDDLNQSLGLTGSQADALSRLDQSANTLSSAWDQAKTKVVSVFADILSKNAEFATGIIKNTGEMIDALTIYFDKLDDTAETYDANLILADEYGEKVRIGTEALTEMEENYNLALLNEQTLRAASLKISIDGVKKQLAADTVILNTARKQIAAHQDKKTAIEAETVATLSNSDVKKKSDMEELARLKLLDRARALSFDVNIGKAEIEQELTNDFMKKANIGTFIQLEERKKAVADYYSKLEEYANKWAEIEKRKLTDKDPKTVTDFKSVEDIEAKKTELLLDGEKTRDAYISNFEKTRTMRRDIAIRELEIQESEKAKFIAESMGEEAGAFNLAQKIKSATFINTLQKMVIAQELSEKQAFGIYKEHNRKLELEKQNFDEASIRGEMRKNAEFNALANDTLETRIDLIKTSYNDEYNFINDMYVKGEISAKEHADKLEQIQKDSDARVAKERKNDFLKYIDGTASLADATSNIFEITYAKQHAAREAAGKKDNAAMVRQWRIAKSFALASATLSAYAASVQAMSDYSNLTPAGKFAAQATVMANALNVVGQAMQVEWTPPRAQGGMVNRNQPYLVGEKGPELFTPGMSGRITDTNSTSKMGGGIQQNVNIINNTPAQVSAQTDEKGDLLIMIRDTIASEVMNPNSKFSKNLSKTRKIERKY